jgi:hypothetical protein
MTLKEKKKKENIFSKNIFLFFILQFFQKKKERF